MPRSCHTHVWPRRPHRSRWSLSNRSVERAFTRAARTQCLAMQCRGWKGCLAFHSQLVGANPSRALTYWAAFRTPVALCSFDATGTSGWVLEMKQKENSQSLFCPVEAYSQCPLEQTSMLSGSTRHHVEIIPTLGLTAGGLLTISCRISSEHPVRALLAITYCTAAKGACRLTKSDGL